MPILLPTLLLASRAPTHGPHLQRVQEAVKEEAAKEEEKEEIKAEVAKEVKEKMEGLNRQKELEHYWKMESVIRSVFH